MYSYIHILINKYLNIIKIKKSIFYNLIGGSTGNSCGTIDDIGGSTGNSCGTSDTIGGSTGNSCGTSDTIGRSIGNSCGTSDTIGRSTGKIFVVLFLHSLHLFFLR
jgi:hypothetical protein